MRRRATRCSPRSARSSSGYSSSIVIAVRNPRPPRFTGNSGISRPRADGARGGEQRAIAAQHDHQQLRLGRHLGRARVHRRGPRSAPHSSSRRTAMPRASSHSISSGTSVAARSLRGLEMMPTALNC